MMKKIKPMTGLIFSILFFVSSAAAENTEEKETGEDSGPKRLFMQVGALEQKDGEKFLLRRRTGHVEFFTNENTKIFIKKEGSRDHLKEGKFLVVRGPRNKSVALANAVYIYDDRQAYLDTQDAGRERAVESSGTRRFNPYVEGWVIKRESENEEQDNLREKKFDIVDESSEEYEIVESEEELSGEKKDDEQEEKEIDSEYVEERETGEEEKREENEEDNEEYDDRPFYIKLADGTVYMVSHDDNTYWIVTEESDKNEIKIGDRLKLYFDTRISIRYKSYPVRIIIERAKAGY
ncbi:MAG: hypothetical protein ACLFP1_05080 [Candidatus Goldiibacteriota bacterium]